ncbi:MAG: hypothetical protein V4723_07135 [Pseudomonadota bacterium]
MSNKPTGGQNASQDGNTGGADKQSQNQQSGSHGSGNPAGQTTQGGNGVQKQRGEGDKQDRLKGERKGSQQSDSQQSDSQRPGSKSGNGNQ